MSGFGWFDWSKDSEDGVFMDTYHESRNPKLALRRGVKQMWEIITKEFKGSRFNIHAWCKTSGRFDNVKDLAPTHARQWLYLTLDEQADYADWYYRNGVIFFEITVTDNTGAERVCYARFSPRGSEWEWWPMPRRRD